MRGRLVVSAAAIALLALPVAASAHPMAVSSLERAGTAAVFLAQEPVDDGGANFETSDNMRVLSFSERRAAPNQFAEFDSDLAFWGDRLYQGHFTGFQIFDIDDPRDPQLLAD